jgi:MFS family permease
MNQKTRILATVSIYHAINDGAISVVPILFPIFISIFNLTYTQIGIITGGSLFISLITQIIVGRGSDGKNCRTTLSIGILLISISLLLLSHTQEFITLLIFIYLLRFSSSFFHPIGVGWISRIFKKDNLDWAMGVHSGFADIGVFIALSTTLLLSELTNWSIPLYIWSISAAIIVIFGITLTNKLNEKYLYVKKTKKKQFFKEAIDETIILLKNIKILIPALIISGGVWAETITYLPLLLYERTDLSLSSVGFLYQFGLV